MKLNKNKLTRHIWFYLIVFTLSIILFLWFFQVVFINNYYEYSKTNQIKNVTDEILQNYDDDVEYLNKLSYEENICIEVVKNRITIYSSNDSIRGCISSSGKYKNDFYENDLEEQTYKLINPLLNTKSLIYAKKYNEDITIFVNASLEPLNNTIGILSNQLIIVSIIVVILSLIIGYFISKSISKPIVKMNEKAKKLANGNYDFTFDNNSNIYEIDELANTLNYAKKELAETDELRRDLLANVSHDLKTPLTMIKGYAEMIRDLNSDNIEKRNANLNVIIEESERLNILVNDLLTLSKIQANKDVLEKEDFDIVELINNIIKRYSIYKDTEGYIFEVNTPDKVIVNADKKKIEQVIYNLINNAINYTGDDNKVIINVLIDKNIRVEIKDTGKGIKKEDLPHIWDKYYHSKKKHKRNVIGTGIGLSIVKTILESHNFKYGVESKRNKGTTFYFEICK